MTVTANENNIIYEIISTSEITNVRFCTIEEQGNYVPNHWHRAVEIIYMLEGSQTIVVESKPYVLKAGGCIVIDANVIHSTKSTQYDAFILLQLPLEFFEKFVPNIYRLTFFFADMGNSSLKKVRLLKQILRRMKGVDDDKKEGFLLHFNQLLFRLMCVLCDNFAGSVYQMNGGQSRKEQVRLNKVLAYVMQNYKNAISLEEIAKVAMFEPKYFCRFFKKHMGVTFKQYQNELRLSYIYRDLLDTQDSLTTILDRHGFNNYKLFRRMFKNHFNDTPMGIRKKLASGGK